MGRFGRPRVSRRRRNLCNGPRQRHHHQGRQQSLSPRNRRIGRARRGNSKRLYCRIRIKRRSVRDRETHRRCRSSRSRSNKTRGDFGRRHRSNFPWPGHASRPRRVGTGGSIPKTSSGKLRREETRQLFIKGRCLKAARRRGCKSRGSARGERYVAWAAKCRLGGTAHLGNRVRRLLRDRFSDLDYSDVLDCQVHRRSARRWTIHFSRAEGAVRVDRLPRTRCWQATHGYAGRENLCVKSHQ